MLLPPGACSHRIPFIFPLPRYKQLVSIILATYCKLQLITKYRQQLLICQLSDTLCPNLLLSMHMSYKLAKPGHGLTYIFVFSIGYCPKLRLYSVLET